ncbi:GIP [Symbiodinium sp. CCMP2592]|nr:GIP [Symbiodinium sp. CCMP2592]
MWNHGGLHGVSRDSVRFPKFVSYVNEVMKRETKGRDLGWSSFIVTKDIATTIHRDAHNLFGTSVFTVTLGEFSEGGVWVERDCSDDPLHLPVEWRPGPDGDPLPGYLVSTKNHPYVLDPKRRHSTEPWTGERWCVSCFTGRAFPDTDARLRDGLRELRFPLRGLSHVLKQKDEIYARTTRPIKSTRKSLWKNAQRLVTLTAWCAMVTSTFVSPTFPPGHDSEGVTLLEIGGTNKTFEAHDYGYLTAEPLVAEDFLGVQGLSTATAVIDELQPSRLWIHLAELRGGLERVLSVVQRQLATGRGAVLEGGLGDECWSSDSIGVFLDLYDYRWERGPPDTWLLHFNPSEFEDVGDHDEPSDQLRRYLLQREGQTDEDQQAYVVDSRPGRGEEPVPDRGGGGAQAISFSKGTPIKKEVQSALKRLHQNLGHPSNEDLARHLRVAGAGSEVVEATKRLQCQVCARSKRASSARPASLPNLLDFNQIVAVDAFSTYDFARRRCEFMMVTDLGTGFSLVGPLTGHSTQSMERDFCTIWSNTFGAPGTLALDLESGLQAGLGRFSEWHGTKLRPAAGQAHFQQGAVERAIQSWKAIWRKLVDEHSVGRNDIQMAVTAINTAVNTRKRDSGYSPAQAVWGRDPALPEDLWGSGHGEQIDHVITRDRKRAREMALRLGAKEAFFKIQNDNKLRRALLQRTRVAGPEVQIGDWVYMYRKPKNCKDWRWIGPATVIGREGPNLWASFAGRCHLVAQEHLRLATGEEIGGAFTLRSTKEDLERLLDRDFAEEEIYVGNDDGDADEGHRIPGAISGRAETAEEEDTDMPFLDLHGTDPPGDEAGQGPTRRRKRKKGPPDVSLEDMPMVPDSPLVSDDEDAGGLQRGHGSGILHEAHMLKLPKTPRGREKALEKELPWAFIPTSQHEAFRAAEQKQWEEHRDHSALEPLSVEASREVNATKGDRILGSRFAYRDKHWSKRKQNSELPWKPKARLVIAGHRDPDLSLGLSTHAPTISRQGIFLLLQLLASNLAGGWTGHAGDVSSAFLCGQELQRELYLRQPKVGLGDLHPEQLLRIKRPIFGLVDSPSSWWDTLRSTLLETEICDEDGKVWHIRQCTLDHCIFMVQEYRGKDEHGEANYERPTAYLGVHVDDILLVGMDTLCSLVKKKLSSVFPIPDWESNSFEYVGSFIDIGANEIKVSQSSYVKTRLFEVEIDKGQKDWEPASETQKHDNMSLVGALSWLASQSRPDLQVGVSLSQQCQKNPCVGDIRFTNANAKRAYEHLDEGVLIRPVDLNQAVLLCYHDAGWANCPQDEDDPYYALTPEENADGIMENGPYDFHLRKAKRTNSCIASQLGGLYLLCDKAVLLGGKHKVSLLDWKSSACDRVCRSTFAAETMGCATAIETGEYILRFLQTLVDGKLARTSTPLRYDIRFLSDCKSLYDNLTKDGIPRPPSCKRLAIDLAAIRDDLKTLGRLAWVPTTAQMADHLTKPLRAGDWWAVLKGGLMLTFREGGDVLNQCQSVKRTAV